MQRSSSVLGRASAVGALLALVATIAAQPSAPARAGVMMEGFYSSCPSGYGYDWWWDHLAQQASTLASDGFSALWIPCALKGASGGYSSGYDPFDDYDLGSKNQEGTIPTHYGSRLQLERLCGILHGDGMQVYEDIVDSHRDGDSGNYSFTYVGAYGVAGAGRFSKSAGDFYSGPGQSSPPYAPMDTTIPDQTDNPDGRWIMPTTDLNTINVSGTNWKYSDYGMKQSGDWLTKALGLDGYRLDDVKASSPSWLNSWLNYGSMAGKFAVGEYYDGSVSNVNGWITNSSGMNNRASAFDFPLKFNYLNPMCNDPSSFNMASLVGAGLIGVNPTEAVTFVENHDTDGSAPITQNKIMAYAFILTSEGYPCVFYKDWSKDAGCYGSGLQAGINNLIWIHEKIASGTTQQRWENSSIYVYERMGGNHLLVGLNSNTSSSATITCATGFGDNVWLHDYTGHEPDVETNGSGNVTITIPQNVNGFGYCCYSVENLSGGFSPAANSITQEYAGASDLDIKPADNTQWVTAAEDYVHSGASISAPLYYDTTGWSSSTDITLELENPAGSVVATKTYYSGTTQGTALTYTANATGLWTFLITSANTPSNNPKPDYWLQTTYTSPSTVIPVTFTIANANPPSGYNVYICGNSTDLGNWNPANAVELNPSGSGSSETWSNEIGLAPSTTFQYKYIVYNGSTVTWESGSNRQITTASSGDMNQNDGNF